MSKWKCDICNSEFNNYHAEGFNNKIYCPLCYYKHEYNDLKQQLSQLQQEKKYLITRIDNTTKYVKSLSSKGRDCQIYWDIKQEILSKLKESDGNE